MAPLILTILGAGPAAPNPGGGNSGYLVRSAGEQTAVMIDCGPGTAGQLPLHLPPRRLSGVVISHFHPDHYFDLVALYYLLKFGEPRPDGYPPRVPLWVPPGGREFLDRFGLLVGRRHRMLEDIFEVRDYPLDRSVQIGSLSFSFHLVQHYIASHAMRIRGESGAILTFSSDVAPCAALIKAARDADLFMCESAMLDASQDEQDPALRGHMTAAEAATAAAEANAKHLLITHYRSGPDNDAHHIASARRFFSGPIDLAYPGATYSVG
jgi:ribonuclease BN (tRNA processing enzyme)